MSTNSPESTLGRGIAVADVDEAEDVIQPVLDEYAAKVTNGERLAKKHDYVECDVNEVSVWLHPREDGSSLDIHFMGGRNSDVLIRLRARVSNYLTREIGFYDIHTPFFGLERVTYRVDFDDLSS